LDETKNNIEIGDFIKHKKIMYTKNQMVQSVLHVDVMPKGKNGFNGGRVAVCYKNDKGRGARVLKRNDEDGASCVSAARAERVSGEAC